MKFLRILFLINTFVVLTFLVVLFSANSYTQLSSEITTEIPKPAAFKLLVKQLTGSTEISTSKKPLTVHFTYWAGSQPLKLPYRVQIDDTTYRITLTSLPTTNRLSALHQSLHHIILKSLVDGSTNIQWKMEYRVKGWSPRLLNRFLWKPALKHFLNEKLAILKKTFAS